MTVDSSNESTYEKCERCEGKGSYTTRFGLPGQNTRVDGVVVERGDGWTRHEGGGYSFAHIEWEDEPRGPFKCGVCVGTGWRKRKPQRNFPTGMVVIGGEDNLSFDEIIEMVGDSPTESDTDNGRKANQGRGTRPD